MAFPHDGKKFEPGQSGNPKGKPKGSKSLSTIIRDLTENTPDWSKIRLKNKEDFTKTYGNNRAWDAIVYVAISQAMAGDQQAREWLRKSGYGDKLTLEGGDKPIPIMGGVSVVPTNQGVQQDSVDAKKSPRLPGGDGGGQDDSDPSVPDRPSPVE